ncbi:hypothetical protein [Paenibacillus sp. Mc5Re-14]|uniref:hypothetical protein n=1 Tax=Paenibacillus sp. Mc5Re-14 TaxID=1030529 RepID=UPI000B259A05|nr:hypothetical protein [Paenibacillus sp. Mc5Re-14]
MSLNFTPLLTAHLFVSKKVLKDHVKELIDRLEENHITINLYEADQPLIDNSLQKPRVYVSLGEEWGEFSALKALPGHEKKTLVTLPITRRNSTYAFIFLLA